MMIEMCVFFRDTFKTGKGIVIHHVHSLQGASSQLILTADRCM